MNSLKTQFQNYRKFFLMKPSIHTVKGFAAQNQENKILQYLKLKIEATGPITVADYMKETLISPVMGYYMKRDVFGTSGDFITSPEISQMFGELIGVWFYNEWMKIGRPEPFQMIEFGPGRGTLTDDILRVFAKFMPPKTKFSIHFIEVSPHLSKIQKSKLCKEDESENLYEKCFDTKYGFPITWHYSLKSVPEAFSLFLAHEFFDAMPVHKLQKTKDGWREILIDFKDGKLQYVLSRTATPATKFISLDEKRDHVEISPATSILMEDILNRTKEDGGISMIIDYGHEGTKTDTFRSFQNHSLQDPLENPGEADLTADVDFSFIKKCTEEKAVVYGPLKQADFLKNMGIEIRLKRLMQSASPEIQKSLKSGYEMLTSENQMGERYKFLALFPLVLKDFLLKYPPAGF